MSKVLKVIKQCQIRITVLNYTVGNTVGKFLSKQEIFINAIIEKQYRQTFQYVYWKFKVT